MVQLPDICKVYLLKCDLYKLAIRDVPEAVLWFHLVMQLTIKHRGLPLHSYLHLCKEGQPEFPLSVPVSFVELYQPFKYTASRPLSVSRWPTFAVTRLVLGISTDTVAARQPK